MKRNARSNVRIVVLVVTGLFTGCLAQSSTDNELRAAGADVVAKREALAQGAVATKHREITIAGDPYSECELSVRRSGETMRVLADDEGLIHFWGDQSATTDVYDLDCTEGAATRHYEFDLSDPATFRPVVARVARQAAVRPGLAKPESLTQAELVAAGYPPRPAADSAMYSEWIKSRRPMRASLLAAVLS